MIVTNQKNHFTLFAMVFLLFISMFYCGCGNSGSSDSGNWVSSEQASSIAVPSPVPSSIFPSAQQIISTYFNQDTVRQMQIDAAPIKAMYNGLNVFSTSMYNTTYITGTVSIKDVFDARIPENYEIFQKYAYDNFGTKLYFFERFAEAANKFMLDFQYDAVLFRPDEMHPVFTDVNNDTWMFLRDYPSAECQQKYTRFYSSRVQNRKIAITGGMKLRMIQPTDALYSSYWMYYIPDTGATYISYVATSAASGEQFAEKDTGPSDYVPQNATSEAINKRRNYGIIESSLSNRTLTAGGWKNSANAQDMVNNGLTFNNNPVSSTWGGWGLYLLPMDTAFWK